MQAAIRYLALLIAVVVLSSYSYAQTPSEGMKGFHTVRISAKIFTQVADNCGVTEASLHSTASYPIAASRMSLLPRVESRFHRGLLLTLAITVFVLEFNGGCVGSYIAEASAPRVVKSGLKENILKVQFWSLAGLIAGPRSGFPRQMSDQIDRIVKDFVVLWTLDQQ